MMQLKKYRWSRDYESAEEELHRFLDAKQFKAERWAATEHQVFPQTSQVVGIKLWCAEGSIFYSVGGQRFSLQPGDALDIPANELYEAVAGISGCVCYQYTAPA
jgi:mannose-6-phosphate isomerase class I